MTMTPVEEVRAFMRTADRSLSVRQCVEQIEKIEHTMMPYPSEHADFLEAVALARPKYVCEIGLSLGNTTWLFSRVASHDAMLMGIEIDVNLPPANFGDYGYAGQRLIVIPHDAHDKATVEMVQRYLDGASLDLLYIDGDHAESSVRTEVDLYLSLVRKGGIVAFHDTSQPHLGSRTVYDELVVGRKGQLFCADPGAYGIGMIEL